jgi:DNA repair exonuclease SbcCD ATPase subunit
MAGKGDTLSEVNIGNVSGGIHGSVIAGRDVSNVTISVGGQQTPADKEPSADELKQLLAEVQQALTELTAQKEALAQISVSAPYTAQGAAAGVQQAAETASGESEVNKEQAQSMQQSLAEAGSLLNNILDAAKSAAEKAGAVGKAAKPIAEALAPLVEKLTVASLWVGRLWLGG